MPAEFDPYLSWLGVPPDARPLDHYRLLGIARFEQRPEVIQQACEERMLRLRQLQVGPRGPLTQQILNELSAARLCLLNSDTKTTYDAALRGMSAGAPKPKVAALAVPAAPPLPAERHPAAPMSTRSTSEFTSIMGHEVRPASAARTRSRRNRLHGALLVFGGTLLVAATVWAVGLMIARSQREIVVALHPQPEPVKPEVSASYAPNSDEPAPTVAVIVEQEGNGVVNLTPATGTIHGDAIELLREGDTDVLVMRDSERDSVEWRFRVNRANTYRVQLRYTAEVETETRLILAVDTERRQFGLRADRRFVTDEQLLAIKSGIHTLTLWSQGDTGGSLAKLAGIRLVPRDAGPE